MIGFSRLSVAFRSLQKPEPFAVTHSDAVTSKFASSFIHVVPWLPEDQLIFVS